ncbi:MAG TPA: TssQ family T6SS-associated lipoprotein [Burkholderiaceae bacterium]|jgi:hypothetical protein|nr:TssQ family T6SS-associated lipoprotein [Burkholderiaceae bacterium]
MRIVRVLVAVLALAGGLAACASLGDPGYSWSDPARQRLHEAIRLYDEGDFLGSVRKLETSSEIWVSSIPVRIAAYKQLAFSNCAAGRRNSCRRAFENLLFLDPSYELSPLEIGHPVWGPVFQQAKRDATTRAVTGVR